MSPVNTDELEVALMLARQRVLKIQSKLHRWTRIGGAPMQLAFFSLTADQIHPGASVTGPSAGRRRR